MLTETGSVVAIDSDGLWVETAKKSACGKCSARHGCGQKLLANVDPQMSYVKALFSSEQSAGWRIGDRVLIGIDEHALVRATLTAYLLPLLALIVGVGLGHYWFASDVAAAVGAGCGLLFGGLFVRAQSRRMQADRDSCYQAKVMGLVSL